MTQGTSDPRLYPAFPLLAVSIALFRGDEVLLIKRAKPPFENQYSLPGGLVETGERLEEAARRELWEEVEMKAGPLIFNRHVEMIERDAALRDPSSGDLRPNTPNSSVKRHFVIASFVGFWALGEGRMNEEVGEILWTAESQLAGLALTPGLASIIASAKAFLIGGA